MKKLAGWKTKFLSFAGRAVLVKSVMSAVPNHVMQGVNLRRHLCDKLDKINKKILWGSTTEKRKLHLVGWEKVIRSKEEGGLGIESARAKNLALLTKLNWRMYHEKEALWAKVLLNKYCSQTRCNSKDPDKLPSSASWKAIKAGFPFFSNGIWWRVGQDSKKNVWLDNWVRGQSLRELIEGPLTREDMKCEIADLRENNSWKWESLSFDLPLSIRDKIQAIPMQEFGGGEDMLLWKIISNSGETNSFQGAWIWEVVSLPKIISFL